MKPSYSIRAVTYFLLLLSFSSLAEEKRIRLRNEAILTQPPVQRMGPGFQAAEAPVSGLYLVQFTGRLQPAWREKLRTWPLELVRYVPDDAFVVRLRDVRLAELRGLDFVQYVGPYRPDHKLHATLRQHRAPEALEIRALLSPQARPEEITAAQGALQRVTRLSRSRFGAVLQGQATAIQLKTLSESPAVLWIEPATKMKLNDAVATKIIGGDDNLAETPPTVHGLGFDGSGVTVAVADSGLNAADLLPMHPDLEGRVKALLFYGNLTDAADEHSHGTHVAGIVAGNAATGERDENGYLLGLGVAPKAGIVVQRIFDGAGNYEAPPTYETLTREAVRAGAEIGSNSWGDDTQGRYDISAAEFDALVRDADALTPGDQPYILEFSAGNAGPGPQTVGSPAVAKNVIASGAAQNNRLDLFIYAEGQEVMADFSSRGPCEDGRIKPDVVAPGTWIASLRSVLADDNNAWAPISESYMYQGGTSQSGPHVSGAAAIFVQYYRQTHSGLTPSPALVKAALINSAVNMDDSLGDTTSVPNQDEGWGRVDLAALLDTPRLFDFEDQAHPLATGQIYEKRFIVSPSEEELKITLVYTDAPGFPASIPALVNDLDLEIIAPDGSLYRGNQFRNGQSVPGSLASDNINNIEAVHLSAPRPGEYILRVTARNVVEDSRRDTAAVDQDFALVISGTLPKPNEAILFFDRDYYRAPDQLQIKLIDRDQAGQAMVPLTLQSELEPGGESIMLRAMGNGGTFTGRVAVVTGPASVDGRIQVAEGNTILALYKDLSSGLDITAEATVDLTPPVITSVFSTNFLGKVILSWQTDEPAFSMVRFGSNAASLNNAFTNQALTTDHQVELSSLQPGTTYFFDVLSADEAGNLALLNNGGAHFSVLVMKAPPILLVDAYETIPDDPSPALDLSAYTDAIHQSGLDFDLWKVSERGSPTAADLKPFQVIIWRINDTLFGDFGLSAIDQSAILSHVNGGGSFFMASMEVLSSGLSPAFLNGVLHVQSFSEDSGVGSLSGAAGDPIGRDISLDLDYTSYNSDFLELIGQTPNVSDTIGTSTNALPILWDVASGRAAGLRYPASGLESTGRVVFLSIPWEAFPAEGTSPNNRGALMRRILQFLAPGENGQGQIALDQGAYNIPSRMTVEVADSDLAGQGQLSVQLLSATEPAGKTIVLRETFKPGLFRAAISLVASPGDHPVEELLVKANDWLRAEYLDASLQVLQTAEAIIDTVAPTLSDLEVEADFVQATFYWTTSKPADALVQYGESSFLGRTAYEAAKGTDHAVLLTGLQPDRLYYYQVVSRDEAGNTVVDDNQGKLYTFRTLRPLSPPWMDNLESGTNDWSVIAGEGTKANWTLGAPSEFSGLTAYSPTNIWGTALGAEPQGEVETFLLSPAIHLGGGNLVTLRFRQNYDFTELTDDIFEYGEVLLVTNFSTAPILISSVAEVSQGWEEATIDLSAHAGKVVYVVWHYVLFSLENHQRVGWNIDDISITTSNISPGSITLANNLNQSVYVLSGPTARQGRGRDLTLTNALPGQYVVTYGEVPFYLTPPSRTNTLAAGQSIVFTGNYTLVDANQNGMADSWEQFYFGNLNHSSQTDSDLDGASDLAEFVAGTNPTNNLSHLRFELPIAPTSGPLVLRWPAVAGRAYQVLRSQDLISWDKASPWIYASNFVGQFSLPPATNSAPQLYRLQVAP